MRKMIRLSFALILGYVAFVSVLWWPVRPMWTRLLIAQGSNILGFCAERNSVHILENSSDPGRSFFLVEREIETGKELGRLNLPFEQEGALGRVQALPGMKKLFVTSRHIDPSKQQKAYEEDGREIQRPETYRILDIQSGATLAGPFSFEGDWWATFSPSGRWFWCQHGTTYGLDVVETATGKTILSIREQSDRRPVHIACFSPESDAVVIHWYYKTGRHALEVYDLPTGRIRFTHLLPFNVKFTWRILNKWERDRIFMMGEALIAGTRIDQQLFSSFQVFPDRLGEPQEEPQFTGYWDRDGGGIGRQQFSHVRGDRIVQLTTMPSFEKPIWVQEFLAWSDKTLGTKWSQPIYGSTRIGVTDRATGKPLYEFASAQLRWTDIAFSWDGRHLASTVHGYPQSRLLMWDADPFPRWPWALGSALLTFLLVYFLPSLRSKPKTPALPTPSNSP